LVLALGNYRALAELTDPGNAEKVTGIVFTVNGQILDMYGKSAGYARANGVTGYGIPLGEMHYSNGTAVQRFGRGRMIVSKEGNRFSFEDDLFESMLENLNSEEMAREFGGKDITQAVINAFAYAWAFSFSEKEGISDSPVNKVSFSKPWIMEAGAEKISVNGFYYKSYNEARDILVLLVSEQLPLRVHRLSGPVLQTILLGKKIAGLKTEKRMGGSSGSGLGKSLTDGFALYGPPLIDPLPLPAEKIRERVSDSENDPELTETIPDVLFLEAQRFAKGWIVSKP
jgi:hypothetical protein